jgi:NAD(P)H dehydrogenase (quinone)
LKKGVSPNNISALVRDEAKAEDLKAKGVVIKIGSYEDYNVLVEAFKGVDKLLLVSGSDPEKRGKQHENVVKATKEAGVKHILYTSFERKNEDETSPLAFIARTHLLTEKLMKESGLAYTILRNNVYMDFVPMFLGDKVLETGIYFPAGAGKAGFALRSEMAEAAAQVLAGEGHEDKEYHISNTENVSFGDIAKMISDITGKQIAYHSPDPVTYIDNLVKAGVPREYALMFAAFGEGIRQGELEAATTDLETLLGRKPTSMKAFLATVYGPGK